MPLSTAALGKRVYEAKLIIKGRKVDAQNGETYTRVHAASDDIATVAASANPQDAREAANAAAAAFRAWSQTPDEARREILLKAAGLILDRVEEFIEIAAMEVGGSERWIRFNCQLASEIFQQAADVTGYQREVTRKGRDADVVSSLIRQPAGVVLGIAPWNAPIVLASRAIAVPLAVGNTVVLKASEKCPKTHSLVIEILNEAGLPKGAANLVTHSPDSAGEIVEALVAHPAIRRVNFTGSTRVGKMIAEICARHLKPVVLELSGKAPLLVLDDADIDEAVRAAAFGAFFNQGQICISTERIVVDRSIADEFVEKLAIKTRSLNVGDPRSGDVDLGTMISADAAIRVHRLIQDAVEKGAQLITGGEIHQTIMEPAVLDHVDSSMRIYREESFGPVAAVIRADGDEEAITVANDTSYGLASAVFSRDVERAKGVAMSLDAGICHINGPTVYDDPAMPFGGVGDSGYGRMSGIESIHEFTELRWLATHKHPGNYPI